MSRWKIEDPSCNRARTVWQKYKEEALPCKNPFLNTTKAKTRQVPETRVPDTLL